MYVNRTPNLVPKNRKINSIPGLIPVGNLDARFQKSIRNDLAFSPEYLRAQSGMKNRINSIQNKL